MMIYPDDHIHEALEKIAGIPSRLRNIVRMAQSGVDADVQIARKLIKQLPRPAQERIHLHTIGKAYGKRGRTAAWVFMGQPHHRVIRKGKWKATGSKKF